MSKILGDLKIDNVLHDNKTWARHRVKWSAILYNVTTQLPQPLSAGALRDVTDRDRWFILIAHLSRTPDLKLWY